MNKSYNVLLNNKYVRSAYNALMTRKPVNSEVVLKFYDKRYDPEKNNISCYLEKKEYTALKRAFQATRDLICIICGEDSIVNDGKGTHGAWTYVGEDNDPILFLRDGDVIIKEMEDYYEFCQDSIGFFPDEWLEYFFHNTIEILEMRAKYKRGENIIGSSIDNTLKNKEILPFLYQYIKRKVVIEFEYKEYKYPQHKVEFHPHFLKEYNGRWVLCGYESDKIEEKKVTHFSLDRIVPDSIRIKENSSMAYVPAPKNYYADFFAYRIGTSQNRYGDCIETIRIRTLTRKMHGYVTTKPFVANQITTIEFGEHENGKYGEIEFKCIINNELMGKILQMGEGLQVIPTEESDTLARLMSERIERMYNLYR